MPILNGLETFRAIKEKFNQINRNQDDRAETHSTQNEVVRPMICYLSQFDRNVMNEFMTKDEEADCYLEKPMVFNDIVALLRLLYLY